MDKKKTSSKPAALWDRFRASSYVELLGILCLIVTYCIIIQSQNPSFLSAANIKNVSKQIVVYGILSCALAFPMIGGTFDLSNGAMAGLGGVICARMITDGFFGLKLPLLGASLVTVAICCCFGAVNGLIVSRTKIPSFIVTIGADIYLRGILYIFSNNTSVTGLPKAFTDISNVEVAGIPLSTLIMIGIFLVSFVVLTKTSFGRQIYAMGGNYQAAYLSGINVRAVRFTVYVICAGLSAVAGILMTSRVGAATPSAGDGYSTIAIAACAMGGVSLDGGSGTIIGVLLGAVMMGMITNGMNLLHIGSNYQMITRGGLMIIAVFYSMWISHLAVKKKKKGEKEKEEGKE